MLYICQNFEKQSYRLWANENRYRFELYNYSTGERTTRLNDDKNLHTLISPYGSNVEKRYTKVRQL